MTRRVFLLKKIFGPNMIRKVLKRIAIALASIISVAVLYAVLAFTLSRITVPAEKMEGKKITIYVLSNGVHTDFVMPVKSEVVDWSREVKFGNTLGKDSLYQYVGMGWGNKRFYMQTPTWADLSLKTGLIATLGLGRSAIHATFYKEITKYDKYIRIELTMDQYRRLVRYIDLTFAKNSAGHYQVIVSNANYGDSDAFYEANGRFTMFYTCNTWLNSGLKACGQRACLWTPFEEAIFYQYRKK